MEEEIINIEETKEEALRRVRVALLNILEDTEEARKLAVDEKNKTMAIIENLTDGILLLDKDLKVELISPLAEEFLRRSKEEIVSNNIFDLISSPDLQGLKDMLSEDNKIKLIYRQEVKIRDKISLEVTTVKITEENGILVILHDVSRDKLIEAMKTEFVSIAAHQLRTPLSAIKWTLRMILDGDAGNISEDQKELLDKIYVSNERMIGLINDMLNVARIEEGRFLYKQENIHLEGVIKEIASSSEGLLKMKNLNLKLNINPIPEVYADKEKIGLVIQNLLENAIKYTPNGGEILISLEKMDNEALFKIKDSGVGIMENDKARIFGKFFRGDNVIRLETDGSGLGLYTSKNIVEAHKGKIWFDSEENKGTSFFFTIPLSK